MPKKKVLLSAYACFDNFGSEPGVGFRWLRALLEKGYSVTLATSEWSYLKLKSESSDVLNAPNLNILVIGNYKKEHFFRINRIIYQFYLTFWQFGLLKKIKSQGISYDVVHHITYGGVTVPSFIGKFGRESFYGPVGGAEWAPLKLAYMCGPRAVLKEMFKKTYVFLIKLDPFLAYTKNNYKTILLKNKFNKAFYGSSDFKCKVKSEISVSEELAETEPRVNKISQKRVVFAGRGLYWKGGSIAISVIQYIHEVLGRDDYILEFYGLGPEMKYWKKKSKENTDYINFNGRLPQEEYLEKITTASCVIFPSFHDSSGNVILESLCKGIPAVAFDLGGPSSILRHDDLLIDPTQSIPKIIKDFAVKVIDAAEMDHKDRVEMSRFYLEQYSHENLLKGVYE